MENIKIDINPQFKGYKHPEKLISAQWLSAHIGNPRLKLLEVDEDSLLYNIGHIPTAMRLNYKEDLSDPVIRDILSPQDFARLMARKGISPDDTVVLYGDKFNCWAAYALWIFDYYGHKDVRLLNGGRDAWMTGEREISYSVPEPTPTTYPCPTPVEPTSRAFFNDIDDSFSLIDARPFEAYIGNISEKKDSFPNTARQGHIPGAINIPWADVLYSNGSFKSFTELTKIFKNFPSRNKIITYCDLGNRSALIWFVLKYLLGYEEVLNYDGSWLEWGNIIRSPIITGES